MDTPLSFGLVANTLQEHRWFFNCKITSEGWHSTHHHARSLENFNNITIFLRDLSRFIVRKYVLSYIKQLKYVLKELAIHYGIENHADFENNKHMIFLEHQNDFFVLFGFDECLKRSDDKLSRYLQDTILLSELAQTMDGKATFVIKRLFKAYLSNPQQLPDPAIIRIIKRCDDSLKDINASDARKRLSTYLTDNSDTVRVVLLRTICDYIAGMTDQFAMQQFNKLYGTNELRSGL